MEPVRLSLNNFTTYRQEQVDLDKISVACLVGDNGAGKSSLLDAITFALFGQGTKGKSLDDYITKGESEGHVALEFRLDDGDTFKVVRGRSLSRGKTTLEFYAEDVDPDRGVKRWITLSRKTITETQKAIEEVLRMDYRTFTASSLILQGKADSFTADMTDQERKEVLARILGLDLWERMQERAKEKIRELKAQEQTLESQRSSLRQVIDSKAQREAERQALLEKIKNTAKFIEAHEKEAADVRTRLGQKQALEQSLSEVVAAINKQAKAREKNEQEICKLRNRIAEADKQLLDLDVLISRREEIEKAVKKEAELAEIVAEWDRKAQEYMKLAEQASELERKVAAFDARLERDIAATETQIEYAREQAAVLDQVPCDPATQSACPLLAQANKAKAEVVGLIKKLGELEAASNPYVEEWQSLVDRRNAIKYNALRHKEAKESLEAVHPVATLKARLDVAAVKVEELQKRIAEAKTQIESLQESSIEIDAETDKLQEKRLKIQGELNALWPLKMKLEELTTRLGAARVEEAEHRKALGMVEQALSDAAKAETELKALEERLKDLRTNLVVYEVLDRACGKKGGVPALIIENAVPEIERLANEMLTRMAGGRLAVRLDTQAEGKTTGTMQEVLRITVLDGGMERPYQTYSGAERFMVDLALRVALSKFLAHRAGAEIRLFVLDEGLGACDAANRKAVMDAIAAVSQEFAKVLVVTHLTELQDAFPQRLEVVKGAEGSKVRVA